MHHGRYSNFIKYIHLVGDVLLLNFAFVISYINQFDLDKVNPEKDKYINFIILFNLAWLISVSKLKIYDIRRIIYQERIISNIMKAIILHMLMVLVYYFTMKASYLSREHMLLTYVLFGFLVVTWRVVFLYLIKNYRKHGGNYTNVIIVGAGMVGEEVHEFISSDLSWGYRFLGYFDDRFPVEENEDVIGKVDEVKEYALKNKVEEIYIALPDRAKDKVVDLMQFCEDNLIRVKLVPDFMRYIKKKIAVDFHGQIPVMLMRQEPLESLTNRFMKRMFDIVFSLMVLILLLSWLYPLIAIIIKITSPGPVLFKQMRTGKANGDFLCYKFRSMHVNKNADKQQAQRDDPRITAFGKFMRKTNIDELPQFINVLIGNMSIVGPRPHMLKHTEMYSKIIDKYMIRHLVKPGITGWAQVAGYRGETKEPSQMEMRVKYDVWYIENWSFLLDIKIIIRTVFNAVKGEENAF